MAKKDKTDETPIEFYIPSSGTGIRHNGPRVPIPINQPHWIYKRYSNTKPGLSEWFVIGTTLILAIALGIFLVAESMFTSPLWIAVISFGIFAILLISSALASTANRSSEVEAEENNNHPRKRKKKHPKHRKDYK